MNRYLIDSDILIDFFKKRQFALDLVAKLISEGEIAASVLNVAELRSGWNEKEARFFLPKLYALLTIEPVNDKIAELAGKLRWKHKRKHVNLPTIDALISATAIVRNYQLVTRNTKDYPMTEVALYKID